MGRAASLDDFTGSVSLDEIGAPTEKAKKLKQTVKKLNPIKSVILARYRDDENTNNLLMNCAYMRGTPRLAEDCSKFAAKNLDTVIILFRIRAAARARIIGTTHISSLSSPL